MLEAAKRSWRESGRPVDSLRFETFGNSGAHPSVPFVVRIPRLGREIAVEVNQTMLEALEDANVAMIFDCRRGGMRPLRLACPGGGRGRRPSGRIFQRRGEGAELEALHLRVRILRRVDHRRHGGPVKRATVPRGRTDIR